MLKRGHLKAIQSVLQSNKQQVKLSGIWREIHDLEGIGELKGHYILLGLSDMERLRKLIQNVEGIDLREQQLDGNRREVAIVVKNEKLSNEAPFASSLLIATRSDKGIPLKSGFSQCPPRGFIGVQGDDIDVSSIKQLVIIENGRAFVDWHLYKFPHDLEEALFVYRGHGSNAKALDSLYKSLPDNVLKVGFYDFDLSGIDMANSRGLDAVLFPYFWSVDFETKKEIILKVNKPSVIALQKNKIGDRYLSFTSKLQQAYEVIDKENITITQESMAAFDIDLKMEIIL